MESLEKVPEFGKYNNRKVLDELEQERDLISLGLTSFGLGNLFACAILLSTTLGVIIMGCSTLISVASPLSLKRIQKLTQVINVMKAIVGSFEEQGVEVFPFIQIEDHKPIDLFVRFPQKVFLLISIETRNNVSVKFNETRNALFVRRKKGKGIKIWKPDPIDHLCQSHLWLKKNRRDLFGGSSKDVRKPLTRVLLLSGDTHLASHEKHLFWKEDERFIQVRTTGNAVLSIEKDIVELIHLFLSHLSQDSSS